MTDNNATETEENIFDGSDFIFTKNADGTVVGGGYKINSLFLHDDVSPMVTINTNRQSGGKVSSPFENLAVPAGLFYVNMRVPKKNINKVSEEHYKEHETISDEMMDKLFSLVEVDKKRKRKTHKLIKNNHTKTNKSKTRRLKKV